MIPSHSVAGDDGPGAHGARARSRRGGGPGRAERPRSAALLGDARRAAGRRWTGCRTPAGGPLTYTWSNHPATMATATYAWQTPGIDTVNASATNWCWSATASLQVTVFPGGDRRVFLPLVLRK